MADENSIEGGASTSKEISESSESTVEINVKTLDSQAYRFRVDKNMPVRLLKEKIANENGIPIEQQRLIFRGKVLKDDHLLSAYHLEDGDTLHLVERQPVQSQPPAGTNSGETNGSNDNRGNDASASRGRMGQVSHSVVLGTFNIGDQNEGIVPDLTRIIGAVLNSIGLGSQIPTGGASNISSGVPSNASSQASRGVETEGTHGRSQAGNQVPHVQTSTNHPAHSLPQPFPAVAVPSYQTPIPDSLNTLSEFINRMELVLSVDGNQASPSPINIGDQQRVDLPSNARGLATPEALCIIMRRAQQLLSGRAVAALSNIAGRLEGDGGSTDLAIRSQIQAESVQAGLAMQHLGALFLELGRTILTLRMGQSPAESVVNAGPAVYISSSGPNPIMVQPFPLQTNSLFGGSVAPQPSPGILGPVGLGDAPRNVNIHIHAVGSRENTGEVTHGEHPNGTRSGDSGPARLLPMRNVIATTLPSRSPAEASAHGLGVFQPSHVSTQQNNQNHPAPAQGPGAAVSSTAQPSESVSIPTLVAEINTQIRNLLGNMRGENQVPSGQSEGSTLQSSSIGTVTGDNVVDHQHENIEVSRADETSGSLTDSISEREEQQVPECLKLSNDAETSGSLSSKEPSSSLTMGGSSSCPSGETTLPHKSGNASADAPQSIQSHDKPEVDKAVPLGLGLGGLQPRRRSRQARSQGKNGGGTSSDTPVNTSAQRVLQSLVSRDSNANGPSGQVHPLFGQIMESMPLGAQGSNAQFDPASMMSQVLDSPALNGLLAGVSEQAGIGSPDGLRNMLEQFTQSPSMRNTLNQIVQQMDGQDLGNFAGVGRGQGGGIDFSRMFQQMMPIVSQALTRGMAQPEPSAGGAETEAQQHFNVSRPVRDVKPDDQSSQIDLHESAQRIERHDPPGDIFCSVVENVAHSYGEGSVSEDLVEELCSDEDLAKEFLEMLHRSIRRRLQADPGTTDES